MSQVTEDKKERKTFRRVRECLGTPKEVKQIFADYYKMLATVPRSERTSDDHKELIRKVNLYRERYYKSKSTTELKRRREYYEKNKEKINAVARKWYYDHKEKKKSTPSSKHPPITQGLCY